MCEHASHTGMCVLTNGHTLIFVSLLGGCTPGKVKITLVILGFPIKRRLWWHIMLLIKRPNINTSREISTNITYHWFKKYWNKSSVVPSIKFSRHHFLVNHWGQNIKWSPSVAFNMKGTLPSWPILTITNFSESKSEHCPLQGPVPRVFLEKIWNTPVWYHHGLLRDESGMFAFLSLQIPL